MSSPRTPEKRAVEKTDLPKESVTFLRRHVLLWLTALRLVNALTLKTFFQPDEYYQALEPAWWFAFGDGTGAWITWVREIWYSYCLY